MYSYGKGAALTRTTRRKGVASERAARPDGPDSAVSDRSLDQSKKLLHDINGLIARANRLRAEYETLQEDFLRADAELERTIRARRRAESNRPRRG